jgi:hypothetical protein
VYLPGDEPVRTAYPSLVPKIYFEQISRYDGTHWGDCWKAHLTCAYRRGYADGLLVETRRRQDSER